MSNSSTQTPVSEDILALGLGLILFLIALPNAAGLDLLGWVVSTSVWTDPGKALAPLSKGYAGLGGPASLLLTFAGLLAALTAVAHLAGWHVRRFALSFSVVFWLAYASWFLGSQANLAAVTPADLQKFGLSWSLHLTAEGGFIIALLLGILIANFLPGFALWLREAIRPELYIKVAIVILGGFVAVTAAEKFSLASTVVLRGIAAIIEAYLVYWAVVYWIARRWFRFNREWAVPLASGVSICGVAAAIATGSAIRARPHIPILVSSLVVVFAVVEVLLLPFLAQYFLSHEPLVAAAWLGLAVKTDGAAVASGAIAESLILTQAAAQGINFQSGWILATTTTIKVFIDIFIGIWSFVLAYIWTRHIHKAAPGEEARLGEIWQRFPKFIIGFVLTFGLVLLAAWGWPQALPQIKAAAAEANALRVIFFLLAFFSIGLQSDFSRLWQQGIGRLAGVYVVGLFGFVIWVGLLISWLFFAGVKPPLVGA